MGLGIHRHNLDPRMDVGASRGLGPTRGWRLTSRLGPQNAFGSYRGLGTHRQSLDSAGGLGPTKVFGPMSMG